MQPTDLTQPTDLPGKKRLPRLYWILLILAGVSAVLYVIQRISQPFADFFNRRVSQYLRLVLAKLTGWLPLSFAEVMLLCLPVLLTVLLVHAIRHHTDSWRSVGLFLLRVVSVLSVFFTLFVWNFSAGYYGATLDSSDKLDLDRQDVSAEELCDTMKLLVEKVNRSASEVHFLAEDFSVMPYTQAEMNEKLIQSYDTFCEEHDFISTYHSRVKPVMLSEAMSYTHITGVYSYFTGEANINTVFPDYTLPFTAAHELAHQRGIAREDEANFIAFLVCIGSDDPYIRYSGYLNMYEYVSSALYRADPDLYAEARAGLSTEVRYELYAYSQFYEKYRESTVSEISGAINDTYLKSQGTVGSKSYGLVVDLCVAYYK